MLIRSLLYGKFQYLRCFSSATPHVLKPGDVFRQKRIFTDEDVLQYSKMSQDSNPLHFDSEAALKVRFDGRLVHGMLIASLFPHIISSYFVCDDRHSELISCLEKHLIYQMRMKLDLSVMEHYERHYPPSERRYNCLIPPPTGYKIPIKWPQSRDEVWNANIPHTHLAHEKSDQNWIAVSSLYILCYYKGSARISRVAKLLMATFCSVNLMFYTVSFHSSSSFCFFFSLLYF